MFNSQICVNLSFRLIRRVSLLKHCVRLYMSANANILKLQQRGLLKSVYPENKLVMFHFLLSGAF